MVFRAQHGRGMDDYRIEALGNHGFQRALAHALRAIVRGTVAVFGTDESPVFVDGLVQGTLLKRMNTKEMHEASHAFRKRYLGGIAHTRDVGLVDTPIEIAFNRDLCREVVHDFDAVEGTAQRSFITDVALDFFHVGWVQSSGILVLQDTHLVALPYQLRNQIRAHVT